MTDESNEKPQSEQVADMRHANFALIATILASGMVILDGTVVNLALPSIADDLHAGLAAKQWIVVGFLVSLSSVILIGGSLGDLFGRKRIYNIGLAGFALSSIVCAASNTVALLVTARFVQGVFGALVVPGSLAIINNAFPKEKRAKAIGTWTAASAGILIAGPFLGGLLVEYSSWRTIFLINIPIIATSLVFSTIGIEESKLERCDPRIDYIGSLLAIFSLGFISGGLIMVGQNKSLSSFALVAVGVALIPFFFIWEKKHPQPVVEFSLFKIRDFSASNLMTFLFYGGLSGLFFILAQQLIGPAGFKPDAAGAAIIPVPIAMVFLASYAGKLSQKYGPRLFMTFGPIICAVGTMLLINVGKGTSYLTGVFPGIAIFALGLSITVAPLTATVMASANDDRAGLASGINNAVTRVAGSLVVAVVGLFSVSSVYKGTIILCVILMTTGGIVSYLGISKQALSR